MTVPVVRWLGSRLKDPSGYDRGCDRPLPLVGRWPRAARFDGRHRYAVAIGDFPVWQGRPPLAEFLRHPGEELSARATAGFLARTERSSLRFPAGFREALGAHLARVSAAQASRLAAA
ncbi:MAG: hypothetical protein K6T74_16975 [Geminicoccaceae bacterium]|nr:hypothetical protein [Geminicoccaceae bacterium]